MQIQAPIVKRHSLDSLSEYIHSLKRSYSKAVIISTETVFASFGEQITLQLKKCQIGIHPIIVPAGETAKSLENAKYCWESMHTYGIDRHSVVIALGGGTVGDLAGFVASTYMRGLDLIMIPTTLLSMIDSGLGGKNGINLQSGKNIIGSFWQPSLILIDPLFLNTLPAREITAGLAEVIKSATIKNSLLFAFLEEHMQTIRALDQEKIERVIQDTCAIKLEVVKADERDTKDIRALLNYGHTFGHAIESATGHSRFLHGEAVSIGMSCAAHLSTLLGLASPGFIERQDALCKSAGLPTKLPDVSTDELLTFMHKDKKASSDSLTFVLCSSIGQAEVRRGVDKELVVKAIANKRVYDNK